jgi:hypothetical protein
MNVGGDAKQAVEMRKSLLDSLIPTATTATGSHPKNQPARGYAF